MRCSVSPWLSIIIPTYNGKKYLESALNSIDIQREKDIEIIAVDDGSQDNTLSILSRCSAKIPIRIIKRPHTGNWVMNTNIGICSASGKYISFLHQDDTWLPGRLTVLKKNIKKSPETDIFFHPSYYINTDLQIIGKWNCPFPAFPLVLHKSDILMKLLVQNFICASAVCFKKEMIGKTGLMNEKLWFAADWDFWLAMINKGKSFYLPCPLTDFRLHSSSLTIKGTTNHVDFYKELKFVAEKHLKLAPPSIRKQARKLAEFSLIINTEMAAAIHRKSYDRLGLIKKCFELSISDWIKFFKYSRIAERVCARLRAGLGNI